MSPTKEFISALDNLSAGKEGWCEVQSGSNDYFTLTIMDKQTFDRYGLLFPTLDDVCKSLPADTKYKPGPHEMIAALSLSVGWQRGFVISTVDNTYHVAMIDIGETEKMITTVQKLPTGFQEIPILGVKGFVTKFLTDKKIFSSKFFKQGQLFKYKIKSRHETTVTADLFSGESNSLTCEVTLERWTPRFEDHGLKSVVLEDGCRVDVVSYTNAQGIYVRSMDNGYDIKWHSIVQQVGAHCLTAPNLSRMPAKGELVASRYSMDDNYYRALVVGFDGDLIFVSYIDFGNKEHVSLDRLKSITQQLKVVPCMAVLVKLNSVTTEYANMKAKLFLDGLVAGSKLLIVKLEGSLPNDLVLSDKKTTVSQLLNQYLRPNWKTALVEGRKPAEATLFSNAVDDITLPTGRLLPLTVLHMPCWDAMWACPRYSPVTRYVLTKMPDELEEYCTAIPDRPYLPRVNEVCAVLCDGKWVRGVCCQYDRLTVQVHLIDFGPTIVAGTNCIRKLCDDFVWPQAIAIPCEIEGLPQVKSVRLLARLQELVPDYSNHLVKVTRVADDGCHQIEMPDLMETLAKEGWLTGQQA